MAAQDGRKTVRFVLVGGFLGAGKTTTLCELGKRLAATGLKVGVITNDQADDLVDSGLARLSNLPVSEIAGGCFCCKFDDLVKSCEEILTAVDPDVILAEPVGSCTDLSATVMQPLKKFYGEWFTVLPYAVLVDPERVDSTLNGAGADSDVGYLFRKQLEEADLIVLSKRDLLSAEAVERLQGALEAAFPETPVVSFSSRTGEGFEEWWQVVQQGGVAGGRILEIDYDTYADAEAALGWLNATVSLSAPSGFDGAKLAVDLLERVRAGAATVNAEIGHVKLLLSTAEGTLRAGFVTAASELDQTGSLSGAVSSATLTFNARVAMPPEDLEQLVRQSVEAVAAAVGATAEVTRLQSFRPGRPNPTHRFTDVVEV